MPQTDPKVLQEYVVTATSGKYKSWEEINSKFPELKEYDPTVLQEYVVTATSGKYNNWDDINGKFPEFFSAEPIKKKEQAQPSANVPKPSNAPWDLGYTGGGQPSAQQQGTQPQSLAEQGTNVLRSANQQTAQKQADEVGIVPIEQQPQQAPRTQPTAERENIARVNKAIQIGVDVDGAYGAAVDGFVEENKDFISQGVKNVQEALSSIGENKAEADKSFAEEQIPFAEDVKLKREASTVDAVERKSQSQANTQAEINERFRSNILNQIPEDKKQDETYLREVEQSIFDNQGMVVDLTGDGKVGDRNMVVSAANSFVKGLDRLGYNLEYYNPVSLFTDKKSKQAVVEANRQRAMDGWDKRITQYEKGLGDSIESGDVANAFGQTLNMIGDSSPTMIAAAAMSSVNPYLGYATMSTLSAGDTYLSVKNEDWFKELSPEGQFAYVAAVGGAEGAGEILGGKVLTRVFKDAIKDITSKAGTETVKGFLKGYAKGLGLNLKDEMIGEMLPSVTEYVATTLAQGGEVTPTGLWGAAKEGMYAGATMAGTMTTAGKALSVPFVAANQLMIKSYGKKLDDLRTSYANAKTPTERQIIADEIVSVSRKRDADVNASFKVYDSMDEADKKRTADISAQLEVGLQNLEEIDQNSDAYQIQKRNLDALQTELFAIEQKYSNQEVTNQVVTKDDAVSDVVNDVVNVSQEQPTIATEKTEAASRKVATNQPINEVELNDAVTEAYSALDAIEKDAAMPSDEKAIMTELIEDEIQKLESYDNITTTETRKVAEERTVRTVKKTPRKTIPSREKDFVGKKATYSDNKGSGGSGIVTVVEAADGREYYVLEAPQRPVYETVGASTELTPKKAKKGKEQTATSTRKVVKVDELGQKFVLGEVGKVFKDAKVNRDKDGNPTSVTMPIGKNGKQVTIKDAQIAQEFDLEQGKQEEFDETIFEETYIEFVGEEQVEVKKPKTQLSDTQNSTKVSPKPDAKPSQKSEKEGTNEPSEKEVKAAEKKTVDEVSKEMADRLRKTKFVKGINDLKNLQSDPTGLLKLAWDGAVETAAKTIEVGGTVAQAVSDAVAHLKNSEWFQSLKKEESRETAIKRLEEELTSGFEKITAENTSVVVKNQKAIIKRAKKGDYTNVVESVLNLVGLPLHKIKDPALVTKLSKELAKLSNTAVAIYDRTAIETLYDEAAAELEKVNTAAREAKEAIKPKKQEDFDKKFKKLEEKVKALSEFKIATEPSAKTGSKSFRAKVAGIQRALSNTKAQAEASLAANEITDDQFLDIIQSVEILELEVKDIAETKDVDFKNHIAKVFAVAKKKTIEGVDTSWMNDEQKTLWTEYVKRIKLFKNANTLALAEDAANIIFDVENGYFPTRNIEMMSRAMFFDQHVDLYNEFTERLKKLRDKETEAKGIRKFFKDFASFIHRRGATIQDVPTKQLALSIRDFSYWDTLLGTKENGYLTKTVLAELIREDTKVKDGVALIGDGFKKILSTGLNISRGAIKSAVESNEKASYKVGMIMLERFWKENYGTSYFDKLVTNETEMNLYDVAERKLVLKTFNSLKKDKDGAIDLDDAQRTMSDKEIKLKFYIENQVMSNLAPKQEVANAKAGLPFKYSLFYFPMMRIGVVNHKGDLTTDSYNSTVNPKVLSDRGKEQKSQLVGAVDINAVRVTMRAASEVLRNYHMYTPLQNANTAYNKMIKSKDPVINGWGRALKSATKTSYNYSYSNLVNSVLKTITNATTSQFLITTSRLFFAETLAEIVRVGGQSNWSKDGVRAMAAQAGSSVSTSASNIMNWMLNTKKDKKASAMVNLFEFTNSPFRLQFTRQNVDAAFEVYEGTMGRQGNSLISRLGNSAMAIPNKMTIPLVWMSNFAAQYKKMSGSQFDFSRTSDKAYMEENREDIESAAAMADSETGMLKGEPAKIAQRTMVKYMPEVLALALGQKKEWAYLDVMKSPNAAKAITFLSGFMYRENMSFTDSVSDVVYAENKTRAIASRDALAQFVSGAVYIWSAAVGGALMKYVVANAMDDDDEEEKALLKVKEMMVPEEMWNTAKRNFVSLQTAKYGQGAKMLLSLSVGAYMRVLYGELETAKTEDEKKAVAKRINDVREEFNTLYYTDPYVIGEAQFKTGGQKSYSMGYVGTDAQNLLNTIYPPVANVTKNVSDAFSIIVDDVVNGNVSTEDGLQLTSSAVSLYLTTQGTALPFHRDVNRFINAAERKEEIRTKEERVKNEIEKLEPELEALNKIAKNKRTKAEQQKIEDLKYRLKNLRSSKTKMAGGRLAVELEEIEMWYKDNPNNKIKYEQKKKKAIELYGETDENELEEIESKPFGEK